MKKLQVLFDGLSSVKGEFHIDDENAIRSDAKADIDPECDGYEYCPLAAFETLESGEHFGNLPAGDPDNWYRYLDGEGNQIHTADGAKGARDYNRKLRSELERVLVGSKQ